MPHVHFCEEPVTPDLALGAKAEKLCALWQGGYPVVPFMTLLPEGLEFCLPGELRSAWVAAQQPDEASIVLSCLEHARLQPMIEVWVREHFPKVNFFAVRSSPRVEDGFETSADLFAGQIEHFLQVPVSRLASRICSLWLSAYHPRVFQFRREHGLPPCPPTPSVIIQPMVRSDYAGASWSVEPEKGRRSRAAVAVVPGLGTILWSSENTPDRYQVNFAGEIVARAVGPKTFAEVPTAGGGVERLDYTRKYQPPPPLEDEKVRAAAALARDIERFLGRPQMVEWACSDGKLTLLQTTGVSDLPPDAEAPLTQWEVGRLDEEFPGPVTPFAFSLARRGVKARVEGLVKHLELKLFPAELPPLDRLLAYQDGHLFWNATAWRKLTARFFRCAPEVAPVAPPGTDPVTGMFLTGDFIHAPSPGRPEDMVQRWRAHRLELRRLAWKKSVEEKLAGMARPLWQARLDELAEDYRDLVAAAFHDWEVVAGTDWQAARTAALLRRLCAEHLLGDREALLNDFLSVRHVPSEGEILGSLHLLANLASADPEFVHTLASAPVEKIQTSLESQRQFRKTWREFLDAQGGKLHEGFKPESQTLAERSGLLARQLGRLALAGSGNASPDGTSIDAEKQTLLNLAEKPGIRKLVQRVAGLARAALAAREDNRAVLCRLHERIRLIVLEMGRRLGSLSLLSSPADVFFLTDTELLDYLAGTAPQGDLKALVEVRRGDATRWASTPETARSPAPAIGSGVVAPEASSGLTTSESRDGLPCHPGRVRGRVRVAWSPDDTNWSPGEILVCSRAHPGWIPVFACAGAIIIEHGHQLSHSTTCLRGIGVPAVTGISGLTLWLRDGDQVQVDGGTGRVTRLSV